MSQRNSIKRKVKKKDQKVYDMTSIGYRIRVLLMKYIYTDLDFIDVLSDNIKSMLSDKINSIEIENATTLLVEYDKDESFDAISSYIYSSYVDTLEDFTIEISDLLYDNDIDIEPGSIPININVFKLNNNMVMVTL